MNTSKLILTIIGVVLLSFTMTGCDALTDAKDSTSTIDSKLVGAWYDAGSKEGIEIATDGTFRLLGVDAQGKLAYVTNPDFIRGKITKAADGAIEVEEVWLDSSKQVTYVSKGTYTFGSNNTTVTITITIVNGETVNHVTTMTKKTIGEVVVSSTFDLQLVAAWYSSADSSGVEIKSDGTIKLLKVDSQGKLAYDTDPDYVSGKVTKGIGGIIETEEKIMEGSTLATYVSKGTYTITNSGANLSVTITEINGKAQNMTYSYVKKNIGDVVIGVTPTPTGQFVSVTVDGQTYNITTTSSYLDGTSIDVSAFGTTISFFNFFTKRTVGAHTIDGDTTGIWYTMGTTTYTSDTGTITITVISGKNTQGTFSAVMQNQANSTQKKNITGSFNVNVP